MTPLKSPVPAPPAKMVRAVISVVVAAAVGGAVAATTNPPTWTADNGNGTFTNPLFHDEFSDPDLIRVGDEFFLTGTTMHAMPGLPVLRSRDLVNWEFVAYAVDRLDLGPSYRLEGGEIYGQGIWAPSFRHHAGTFHIFTNVNGRKTQLLRATNPAGPWTRTELGSSLHDLSVLFDDDGRVYVAWGYNEIQFAELKPDLTDIIPETKRVLIPKGRGMGEGVHFYKIGGKYFLLSANYDPVGFMACARADRPEGPYEVVTISADETLGVGFGWRLKGQRRGPAGFELEPPRPGFAGANPLHQGGIVQTPAGEWWGFSMMDHNSVGRLTCLSPVTWTDGWPYFGLPGNLTRSPRTWVKPKTAAAIAPHAPYERSDDFAGPKLKPVWQWNHASDDAKWSLAERPGFLRLHTLPATEFWTARNSLTQRAVGPASTVTVELDAAGLKSGDVAGLALLNLPYAWIGVTRTDAGLALAQFDQLSGETKTAPLAGTRVWLRAACDFDAETANFSFSTDGASFAPLGRAFTTVFQLKTFQGVRCALFGYNTAGAPGGVADFDRVTVDEPRANGRTPNIPLGKIIALTSVADGTRLASWNGRLRPFAANAKEAASPAAKFRVLDRGTGRVALEALDGSGLVAVLGEGGTGNVFVRPDAPDAATLFQWQDMLRGDVMFLSLVTNRHLLAPPNSGSLTSADSPGAAPDRREGSCFRWEVFGE